MLFPDIHLDPKADLHHLVQFLQLEVEDLHMAQQVVQEDLVVAVLQDYLQIEQVEQEQTIQDQHSKDILVELVEVEPQMVVVVVELAPRVLQELQVREEMVEMDLLLQ